MISSLTYCTVIVVYKKFWTKRLRNFWLFPPPPPPHACYVTAQT